MVEPSSFIKKIVLTGGPCAGKSTVQTMLSDVFENMGWKVFRVPETATILLSGGVNFAELSEEQAFQFQLDLLRTMLSIEETFLNLANSEASKGKKCVVIFDRGAMDASAYIDRESWLKILKIVGRSEVELRDQRYDYVVHLVTAALGAEKFYGKQNNHARSESIELARKLDKLCQNAWVGHPYFDVVDNSTNFDQKCNRVIGSLLNRLGFEDKRYGQDVEKFKFLVNPKFNISAEFPVSYQDFEVEHSYLQSGDDGSQVRIRRRSQNGVSHFNLTVRSLSYMNKRGLDYGIESPVSKDKNSSPAVETRKSLAGREYDALLLQADPKRHSILKTRRCFLWDNKYYQVDLYRKPSNGLIILEAYLEKREATETLDKVLPPFIPVLQDITGDSSYSMYKLSLKE